MTGNPWDNDAAAPLAPAPANPAMPWASDPEAQPASAPTNDPDVQQLVKNAPGIQTAQSPLQAFDAGLQHSASGMLTGKPNMNEPKNASFMDTVASGVGEGLGDLPFNIMGAVAGGMAGAGATAETGPGAAVGGAVGAGAGMMALPEAVRQTMMDVYNRGNIHSFGGFLSTVAKNAWAIGKSSAVGAIAGPAGEGAGALAEHVGLPAFAKTVANVLGFSTAATGIQSAWDDHAPNLEDFAANAVSGLALGLGGHLMENGNVRMTDAGDVRRTTLEGVYRQTGIPPWMANHMAARDPSLAQELNTVDVNGLPVLPKFNLLRLPEPEPYSTKRSALTLDDEHQQQMSDIHAEAATGHFIENDLLPKLRVQPTYRETLKDTRGGGVQYHGARTPIGKLGEGYYNDKNIYGGTGFYTTDAADIAKGYARKSPTAAYYQAKERAPVNTFDMEEPKSVDEWNKLLNVDVHGSDDIGAAIDSAAEQNDGKPNLRQIMDEMRDASAHQGISRDSVQEQFDRIQYNLEQQGFGAMRHVGGLKTDNAPHNVKIYFRPHEQLDLESLDELPTDREMVSNGDDYIGADGGVGRYQVNPGLARQYGFEAGDLLDPVKNERAARTILADLTRRFHGDPDAILAAYKGGQSAAWRFTRAGNDLAILPPPTQHFLAGIGADENLPAEGGGSGGKPPGPPKPPEPEMGPDGRPDFSKMSDQALLERYQDRVGTPATRGKWTLKGLEFELDALRKVDKTLITRGLLDPKTELTLEDMGRQTYGSDTRLNHFVFKGPIDPLTFESKEGVSLADVAKEIENVGGSKDEFNAYRVAMRTLEKAEQGIDTGVFKGGVDEARAVANRFDNKYRKANDLMQQWKHGLLEYVRDSGGISQEQLDRLEALNTSHVSLRRLMGDDEPFLAPRGNGRGFRAKNPLAKMEGSDRQIIDPWTADIDNARMMIRFADRNRAIGWLVGAQERMDAAGVRRVLMTGKEPMYAPPGSNKFEPYFGPDEDTSAFDPFLVKPTNELGKTHFVYHNNGKPEVYEAGDENVARMFNVASSPGETTMIEHVAQIPAKLARAGITIDPSFGPRVALRHQLTAYIADPLHPPPFVTMLGSIFDAFGEGEGFWALSRAGGLTGSITDIDKTLVQNDAQNLLDKTGVFKRAWNTVMHPIELAQMVTDRLSMASRIGYYKRAVAMGYEPAKAAMMARKAYLDYDEKFVANFANAWAKYVPFFKADVLGLRQGWDAVQPGKLGKTAMYTGLGLVLPQIALYAANRAQDQYLPPNQQYKNLPQIDRDLYFITPQIGGVRFRLGKPFNFGPTIGILTERFLEHTFEHDPHAFDHMLKPMMDPLPTGLPQFAEPVIEDIANYNFFTGRPLVPDSLKQATPDMQYEPYTSAAAKTIARVLSDHDGLGHAVPGLKPFLPQISPIVLDNYVQEWGGTLGMSILHALDAPLGGNSGDRQIADLPFVHSFLVRNPGMSAQPVQDFYNSAQKFLQAHQDEMLEKKSGDIPMAIQDAQMGQRYSMIEHMFHALAVQRATLQAIDSNPKMTTDDKRQLTDRITNDAILLSQFGMKILSGKPVDQADESALSDRVTNDIQEAQP